MLRNSLVGITNSEIVISNIPVTPVEWTEESPATFPNFKYKAVIKNSQILGGYLVTLFVPEVTTEGIQGVFSPYFYTKEGELTIYAKAIPPKFTILTLRLNKCDENSHWSCLGVGESEKIEYVGIKNDEIIMGQKTFNQPIIANEGLTSTHGNIVTETGTIKGSKVYNAIWNDYAEWFEKENKDNIFEPGDICSWNENGIILSNKQNNSIPIGVYSDSYGIIVGGQDLQDMEQNIENYIPIGLSGRVKVKIQGKIKKGDFISISKKDGVGKKANKLTPIKNIIGISLEDKNTTKIEKIKMLIK